MAINSNDTIGNISFTEILSYILGRVDSIPDYIENAYIYIAGSVVVINGYTVPSLLIFVVALFGIALLSNPLFRKKKPWRIAASKRWLKMFRSNEYKYSPKQRFAYVRNVDHFLWEEILMSCFEERGYSIIRTKMTRDGGSDGFVKIGGDQIVIQAKRYKGSISKAHVMDLNSLVRRNKRLDKGLFIHTGRTSGPILKHFRINPNLELLSGVDRVLEFLDGDEIVLFSNRLNKLRGR